MYTKENLTTKDATLLVDGKIIAGSIFNETQFVAGTWLGFKSANAKFEAERRHPITNVRLVDGPFTFDVGGRTPDVLDDGFGMVQHVYRVARQEVA